MVQNTSKSFIGYLNGEGGEAFGFSLDATEKERRHGGRKCPVHYGEYYD